MNKENGDIVEKMKKSIKSIFQYLQQRFPKLYQLYCKVRYPDSWGIWPNLGGHIRIIVRRVLLFVHLDKLNAQMRAIQKFRNIHLGERCFIVGTGKSLKYDDLERIKNEVSFSANSIFLTYSNTSWRPDYYGIIDHFVYAEDFSKYAEGDLCEYAKENIFLTYKIQNIKNEENVIRLLIHNGNHTKRSLQKRSFKQEKDISVCVYDCFTVTNMLIDIAVYMGFKEIYLLGIDCDYSTKKVHIEDTLADKVRESKPDYLLPNTELMIEGYRLMRDLAEQQGCVIYNATRGGKLEVLERIELETIFKDNKEENKYESSSSYSGTL